MAFSSFNTKATDKQAADAIRDQDLATFRTLLANRTVTREDPWLVTEVVRWGDPEAVTLAAQYFAGRGLARGLNEALQTQRMDLATLLMEHADRRPQRPDERVLDRTVALHAAAVSGQLIAMKALLGMGISLDDADHRNHRVLEGAAAGDQVEMLAYLWPLRTNAAEREDALLEATRSHAKDALAWLWDKVSPVAQSMALHMAAQDVKRWTKRGPREENMERLGFMLALASVTPTLPDVVYTAATLTFEEMVHQEEWDKAARLVPWVNPRHEHALPLRLAIEAKREDWIAHLLPLSDVTAARQAWTQMRPPRWDCVDALATLVGDDQRKAWLSDKKNLHHLPQAQALERQEKTLATPPPASRSRPRRRT